MPPSATASNTTPAWLRPDCGRASVLFSIITPVTGRWLTLGATGKPVSVDGTVLETDLMVKVACLIGAGAWAVRVIVRATTPPANTTTATAMIINCFLVGRQFNKSRQ